MAGGKKNKVVGIRRPDKSGFKAICRNDCAYDGTVERAYYCGVYCSCPIHRASWVVLWGTHPTIKSGFKTTWCPINQAMTNSEQNQRRKLLKTIHLYFTLTLLGCLLLSMTPAAQGFIALEHERGQRHEIMIDKVHEPHWDIAYKLRG